jgi:2-polyprenyl-6-methoxyphenol hydroxylase-like FAD-dependent oxidoreductase
MTNRNVLISGASIAGPALAYWLHRHGFNPTIVERAPALRDGGYAVDFRGEAHLSILRRMGLLPEIERCMGSGLALVGAYVLAGELAAARGDHRVAFARYEREMREYAAGCQKMGDGVAKLMIPGNRFVASALNRYYRLMPYLPGKNMAAKMARRTAENIKLRDYPLPARH